MSPAEVRRLEAMQALLSKQLSQRDVARMLAISVRQVKRLWRRYQDDGAGGLVSRKRGCCSNRKTDARVLQRALDLVKERYDDFGPTLASEKLADEYGIRINRETLRCAMIGAGIWKATKRDRTYHLPRARREQYGEMIQIDGSPHYWFEQRGPKCTLIVFIDDATSKIVAARFFPGETTNAYFVTATEYFARCGLPQTLYSDRYSVFRTNREARSQPAERTQFARAMKQLGVELICANSPQAKGRVERANRTLQDRLVKELRLAEINSINAANDFLPAYLDRHNSRFARSPRNSTDAHIAVDAEQLHHAMACRYSRKLTKNLTFQFGSRFFAVVEPDQQYAFPKARIDVIDYADGSIGAERLGHAFTLQPIQAPEQPQIRDAKDLEISPRPKGHTPAKQHPWRGTYHRDDTSRPWTAKGRF